jgi:predicted ferric reductase
MKKTFLILCMGVFAALPVFFLSRMLTGGLPWPAYLYEAGRLCAITGFVLLVFQYVLSSKIKWIERGIGLDRLFGIHRVCGGIALALITAHPVLILLSERLQGYATPIGFLKILGIIAMTLVWATAGVALLYGRIPMCYDLWKRIHRVGYVILPLAFTHSFLMGSTLQQWPIRGFWVILALIYSAVVFDKIGKHAVSIRHPLSVRSVLQETDDIWRLDFEGDHPDYVPGQFMFVRLQTEGRLSAPHPFTIASSPAQEGLAICAKAVGDFTSGLRETRPSDVAYVDMPYGVFSFVYRNADRLIFIAGGIGITPFLSMLRYMRDRNLRKEVILLWGNKTEKDIAFGAELDSMVSNLPSLKVVHILSRQANWPGPKGRIDREMLKKQVEDFTRGEYFVCGPPPMMKDVRKALYGLGVPRSHIHSERFALR